MTTPNITKKIVDWITCEHDIPLTVSKQILTCFIDTLSVGIGASKLPFTGQFLSFIEENYPGDDVSLWNSGKKANLLGAVFYNTTVSHALDYDDTCWAGFTHPSIIFVPVAMALAEKFNIGYAKIAEGIALSYEIMGRIGLCDKDFHRKGWLTSASFGSTATAILTGKLLGFNEEQLENAIGLSMTGCGAIRGNNGTMAKWVSMGIPAQQGVKAALLAKHGFTASAQPFEGREGFFHATGSTPDYSVFDNLNSFQIWTAYPPAFKYFPSCSSTHASMEAAHNIFTKESLDPSDIVKIECQLTTSSAKFVNNNLPKNEKDAAFSITYCISALLVKRSFGIQELYPGCWNDPHIKALMDKISFTSVSQFKEGTEEQFPEGANVILTTRNDQFQNFVGFAKGAGDNRLTEDEHKQKFDTCVEYAGLQEKENMWEELNSLEKTQKLNGVLHSIR